MMYCLVHYQSTQKKLSSAREATERVTQEENAKKAKLFEEHVKQQSTSSAANQANDVPQIEQTLHAKQMVDVMQQIVVLTGEKKVVSWFYCCTDSLFC